MSYWNRFKQSWRPTSGWNKLLVILTAVLAFANLGYVWYAHKQFGAMDGQLQQMQSAGQQTDKLIGAAKAQSEAASDMADAAGDQVDAANNFSDSAEEINRNTAAAVSEFARLAKSSEDNIRAIQQSTRLEQRAWVGINTYKFPKVDPTANFDYGVGAVNYGKTFALGAVINTHVSFAAEELETEDKLKEGVATPAKPESVALLTPGIPYQNNSSIPKETVSSVNPFFHSRGLKLEYVYLWGIISYNDVFKDHHTTIFCFYRREDDPKGEIEQCKFHNDAN